MKTPAWLLLAACAPLALAAQSPLRLKVSAKTVTWGHYWAQDKPVLTIRPGQTVVVDTLLTNSPIGLSRAGVPQNQIEATLKEVYADVPRADRGPGGHILTGPIYVAGAEPGDTLAVHILKITGRIPYAYNAFGPRSGFLPEYFPGQHQMKIIPLDWKTMLAHFAPGIDIPMHPFFGSMGVAPPLADGKHSSVPPDLMGGNMDNKDLVAGSTVYFPVFTPGALFYVGDGHAGQGDGEIDITALETSLEGTFRFELIKHTHQSWPRAETPTEYISMGFNRDLVAATKQATEQMIDFLAATKGLSKQDAYMLCSVAGNVHITELVDQNVGVHVLVAKSLFH
ncbi:MAG TPA: acetamidase/formamidase family protein [Terriglobales bacterium]|nr:acetamidase/formamidase family protein [Terriglobales bacterium]